jgi:predicted CXXCH cytochrome family protein
MTLPFRRRLTVTVIAAGVVGVGIWIAFFTGDDQDAERDGSNGKGPQPPSIPAVSSSPYLNTKLTATYVGMEKCVACHDEQHTSFLATPHSRAMRRVDPSDEPPDVEYHQRKSGRSYRVYRSDGKLRHREFIADGEKGDIVLGDYPVAFGIGSGDHARGYIMNIDGFLVESPITWYASRKAWGMSPGYDQPNHFGFNRPITQLCVSCHSGRVETIDDSLHKLRISEMTVSCEKCHGPGSLHVQQRKAKIDVGKGIDYTIVNPANLSRELNESVCARCHLNGAASVVLRGRFHRNFRPGLPLSDFRVDYRLDQPEASMKITGHFEQMRLSRCYTQTKTLTCTTCHNPHGRPEPSMKIEYFRKKCLSCHQDDAACKLPDKPRLMKSPQNDCVQCHMPKADTEVPHLAFIHHRIGLNQKRKFEMPSQPGRLVPVSNVSRLSNIDQERCLGLGHFLVALSDNPFPEDHRRRAFDLLNSAYEAGVRDPDAVATLAMLSRPPRNVSMAKEALERGRGYPQATSNALQVLGESYMTRQEWKDAVRVMEKTVKSLRHPKAWTYLAEARARSDDLKGAIAAMRQAVALSGDRPELHAFLAQLYVKTGKPVLAQKHFDLAERLAKLQNSRNNRTP